MYDLWPNIEPHTALAMDYYTMLYARFFYFSLPLKLGKKRDPLESPQTASKLFYGDGPLPMDHAPGMVRCHGPLGGPFFYFPGRGDLTFSPISATFCKHFYRAHDWKASYPRSL